MTGQRKGAEVTITCPGGCGDKLTVKAEDAKDAECAQCYWSRILPADYFKEAA